MTDLPDFSADEVNELSRRGRTGSEKQQEYYQKALKFIYDYLDGKVDLTNDPQGKKRRWLWGIKADLKE